MAQDGVEKIFSTFFYLRDVISRSIPLHILPVRVRSVSDRQNLPKFLSLLTSLVTHTGGASPILNIRTIANWLKSSSRNGREVSTIVIHATAGKSAKSSISYMLREGVAASYHYLIERDGTIYKCVPTSKKAWHAGKSEGPQGKDVNPYSIGIAFANLNDGKELITPAQIASCKALCEALCEAYPIRWITTHYGVSYPRKTDPRRFDLFAFVETLNCKERVDGWLLPHVPKIT